MKNCECPQTELKNFMLGEAEPLRLVKLGEEEWLCVSRRREHI